MIDLRIIAAAIALAAVAAAYITGRSDGRAAVNAELAAARESFRAAADQIATAEAVRRARAAADLARHIDALPKDDAHACGDSPALRDALDRLRGIADAP